MSGLILLNRPHIDYDDFPLFYTFEECVAIQSGQFVTAGEKTLSNALDFRETVLCQEAE